MEGRKGASQEKNGREVRTLAGPRKEPSPRGREVACRVERKKGK